MFSLSQSAKYMTAGFSHVRIYPCACNAPPTLLAFLKFITHLPHDFGCCTGCGTTGIAITDDLFLKMQFFKAEIHKKRRYMYYMYNELNIRQQKKMSHKTLHRRLVGRLCNQAARLLSLASFLASVSEN